MGTDTNKLYFPLKLELRIDWSELDLFGIVNNVMYFKYIQVSRVNYWELTGLTAEYDRAKIGPLLASTSCQFRKQLLYPGNIIVQARVEFIKNTSFGMHHQIINSNNEIAAEAHDIIVVYYFNKKEKVLFPSELRSAVEKMENRTFETSAENPQVNG